MRAKQTIIIALLAAIVANSTAFGQLLSDVARQKGISIDDARRLMTQRDLTPAALQKLPSPALARAMRRLAFPDLPARREAFWKLQQLNEEKTIPANAFQKARLQLNTLRNTARSFTAGIPTGNLISSQSLLSHQGQTFRDLTHPGGSATKQWTALGPSNIGGRTRSILIDPQHPEVMWCGSVGGGVWRSTNSGTTFTPADDYMANLAVTCLVMDPSNHNLIYAGTGEGFYNIDAIRGAGIFVTRDALNWTQIPSTSGPDFYYVNRLALSVSGQVLLAATTNGIFRSSDATRSNWTNVLPGEFADVVFDSHNELRAIAGGLYGGAYCSTNGGSDWSLASGSETWTGRVELAIASADSSVVYASVANGYGQIWKSLDYGASYTKQSAQTSDGIAVSYLGIQGWYDNAIWAGHPSNPNFVVVGGIDLWQSVDGGQTLTQISAWNEPSSAHSDQHAIVSSPAFDGISNNTIFFGNDGGIYKADDVLSVGRDASHTMGWSKIADGYAVTQFFAGSGNSHDVIIGGAQDCGTLCYNPKNGSRWTLINGGDGGYCYADQNDQNYLYGEYIYLDLFRSSDGGSNIDYISGSYWNGANWGWLPPPYSIPDAQSTNALFIAPFVMDPNNSQRMLAGGLSLWLTENAKAEVTQTSGPRWRFVKSSIGQPISTIAVMPNNSNIGFVGHQDGEIFKSTNLLSNPCRWAPIGISGNIVLPKRYCMRIIFDPSNNSTIYVAFGGFSPGNLFKSTDGGDTWTNVSRGLPDAPVRAIAVHPKNSALLYIGTEVGLLTSDDGGLTWFSTSEGPTSCAVDDLFWMGTKLTAATHGRGMFQIDIP